jgi:hypothetical protein
MSSVDIRDCRGELQRQGCVADVFFTGDFYELSDSFDKKTAHTPQIPAHQTVRGLRSQSDR